MFTIQSFSQKVFTVNNQQLTVLLFDTIVEPTFVYEVGNAVLYFRQTDILSFINNSNKVKSYPSSSFVKLFDTLLFSTVKIKIIDNLFSYDSAQLKITQSPSENQSILKINEEFYFAGAELILQGLFMVYSKKDKVFYQKNLSVKKISGLMGQKNLSFFLPNGEIFYSVLLTLGE